MNPCLIPRSDPRSRSGPAPHPAPGDAPTPAFPRRRGDAGQATAEYALVILGAAAIALLVLAWATDSGRIGDLLDAVVDQVIEQVS